MLLWNCSSIQGPTASILLLHCFWFSLLAFQPVIARIFMSYSVLSNHLVEGHLFLLPFEFVQLIFLMGASYCKCACHLTTLAFTTCIIIILSYKTDTVPGLTCYTMYYSHLLGHLFSWESVRYFQLTACHKCPAFGTR